MKRLILSTFALILLIPFLAFGQEDYISKVKTPNVMIIFDTSGSMGMSVNVDKYGNSIWTNKYGPDTVTQYRKDGNHPDSRLYQAKKALSEIIDQVVKDKVNLGFSTFAQRRIERSRGLYKHDEKIIDQYAQTAAEIRYKRYYIWGKTNDGTRYATSIYSDSFVDAWSITRSSVVADPTTGTTFDRAIWIHDKSGPLHPQVCSSGAQCVGYYGYFLATKPYTITYRVTARTLNAETNVYTYTYKPISSDYDYYGEYVFNDGWTSPSKDCGLDQKNNPWNWRQGSSPNYWYTHFSDDADPTEYNSPSLGRTANWWKCSWNSRPQKDEISHTEPRYKWDDTWGSSCDQTKPGTPVWDLQTGTCFDWSYFRYDPSTDINGDKPHTWSYHEINSGKWRKNQQPNPFYAALPGGPGQGNNHHFFVNFPDDKDALFKDSDRTTFKNTIMSYLDLTAVKRPDASEYWTKLPIHALSGKTGLSENGDAFDSKKQTPLADTLAWTYTYFDDYINKYNGGDPASNEKFGELLCRGNYVILLTDGLESCRYTDPPTNQNPDYTAAVTEAGNLYSINVKTFVIGFGSDIKGNDTLNKIALAGSDGKYNAFFAGNFDQLKDALRTIFQLIAGQFYGRSNPVVTKKRDRLYRGNFDLRDGDYMGHLMAWNADPKTGVLAPDFVWDSGEKITINGRGKVYTWTDNTKTNPLRVEFTASESSLYSLVNPLGEDINNDGPSNDLDAIGVIKFTLDPNYNDCDDGVIDKSTLACHGAGYYKGKRALNVDIKGTSYPSWKLGDIWHSTPVVIGAPAFYFGTENNYNNFFTNYASRDVMIYVGTNDGMLHGFWDKDGTEKFAIIPRCLLGKLRNLKSTHDFYVDSSPKAYDVYFKSESTWKTVLVSGLRGGGPYYFAVDVTDPSNPKILWEWPNPYDPLNPDPVTAHLGNTWGKPDIGRVKVGTETKYVAFVTGGYTDPTNSLYDNLGNSFHIIDIETGMALKSFVVGNATNKIPSGPTAYDFDQDSFVNYVYFGDYQGTLWKVDVSSNVVGDWTLYEFWKDPTWQKRLPIFYAPAVTKNDAGDILIFFGTGNEMNLTDPDKFYAFYEVKDQGTTGIDIWTRNLDPGEKVLGSPTVANWVVYFTTWTSTGGVEYCGAGEGRLYGLKISKVGAPGSSEGLVTLDPATGTWTAPQSYISLGAGIPSAPLVTNGMIYIGTSLNANRIIQIPIPGWLVARIRAWREVF